MPHTLVARTRTGAPGTRNDNARRVPTASGKLRLIGADFLVFADAWHAGNVATPQLGGQLLHLFESPNRFGLPDFYQGDGTYSAYGEFNLMASDYSQHMTVFGKQDLGWVVPEVLQPGEIDQLQVDLCDVAHRDVVVVEDPVRGLFVGREGGARGGSGSSAREQTNTSSVTPSTSGGGRPSFEADACAASSAARIISDPPPA